MALITCFLRMKVMALITCFVCLLERSSYALTWLSLTQPLDVLQKEDLTIKEKTIRCLLLFCKNEIEIRQEQAMAYLPCFSQAANLKSLVTSCFAHSIFMQHDTTKNDVK